MKKIFLLIISLLVNTISLFAQDHNIKSYKISVIDYPQQVELFEYNSNKYVGHIITKIRLDHNRGGWLSRTWKNIWNVKSETITDTTQIDKVIVKELMTELEKHNIEILKDCSEDQECNEHLYLDGGSVSFTIKTPQIDRVYGFSELYPLNKRYKYKEKVTLRIQAQKLLTILYKNIDLNQKFYNVIDSQKRGYYSWYRSSGNAIVTIKNKKRKNKTN